MRKKIFIVVIVCLLITGTAVYLKFNDRIFTAKSEAAMPVEYAQENISWQDTTSGKLKIEALWIMPAELFEISGISWYMENKIACIQDELGTIYIFDLVSRKVVETIAFAPPGDFEGITWTGKYFYALRSDGIIYRIDPANPAAAIYFSSGLSKKQNCEGLGFDKENNRLLIAIKGADPLNTKFKGIYAYDLAKEKMDNKSAGSIELSDPQFDSDEQRHPSILKRFEPSAIAVHPFSKQYYIASAGTTSLIIFSPPQNIHSLIKLDKTTLPKAEGITFSPKGEIYISSEGGKGLGNGVIVRCKIN